MMKLVFLTIIGLTVVLVNLVNGQAYRDCRNPRVPDKKPTYSYNEERYMKTLSKELYDTWVRPMGGTSPPRGPSNNVKRNRKGRRRRRRRRRQRSIPRPVNHYMPYYPPVGGSRPARRVEYRQMTKREMDTFHRCVQLLKSRGDYDEFTRQHSFDRAPAAHLGAAFLPWHRHFLYTMLQALRRLPNCRDVFVPYWDCTLDQRLPSPHHAVQWQDKFWGNNQGDVTSGQLGKGWSVIDECTDTGRRLKREVNTTGMDFCSRENMLNQLTPRTYAQLMAFGDGLQMSEFELAHGGIHCYVGTCGIDAGPAGCGGHVGCVDCSPSDPVFFLLHSFVDCLWYEWASLPGRSNIYPTSNVPGGRNHSATNEMRPFRGLQNRDGFYDSGYSRCVPRPGRQGFRCNNDDDCDSPLDMLWCSDRCECVSKVREGGNCQGLPDKACYCGVGRRGDCYGNRCRC